METAGIKSADNNSHGSEAKGDLDALEITGSGLSGEDLASENTRGVADTEDEADGGGALEVAGKVAVEPGDVEAALQIVSGESKQSKM